MFGKMEDGLWRQPIRMMPTRLGAELMEHIDIVWAENRDEIFFSRLTEDIEKLQQAGFQDATIKRMLGCMDYVRFWLAWPSWAFPANKLPKGYKWSDGTKYRKKGGKKSDAELYTFLPVGNDLYIKSGAGEPMMPGLNAHEKTFLRIINFRTVTANKFLQKIEGSSFFRECVLKYWKESGVRLGWVEPCLKDI